MRRVLFEIPGIHVKLHGFGVMLCLAFLAAILLADWRARRVKINPDWIYDVSLWVLLGGLVGARGLYVAQYWGKHIKSWTEIFAIWEGGIVLYGGVAGAIIAGVYRAYRMRLPVLAVCDVIAPSVALGLAIGRLGCFLNGCCYGDPCTLPWAVTFPAETAPWYQHVRSGEIVFPAPGAKAPWGQYLEVLDKDDRVERVLRDTAVGPLPRAPVDEQRVVEDPETGQKQAVPARSVSIGMRSLPVHPTQLYSTIDGLVLLALLSAYYPIRKRDGEVAALLMVTYPVTRFLIEHLRGDEGAFFAGLTISQTVSIGLFLLGLAAWVWLARRPKVRYEDTADPIAEKTATPAEARA